MVGIKGTGMSGLALVLASLGIKVTGSDSADSFLLLDQKNFDRAGIVITTPFDEKKVPTDANAVISSTSHDSKNIELMEARRRGIPVLSYPEIVGMLTEQFKTIAVCGSHGKTTTTNLLAHILQQAGVPILALAGPTSQQVLDHLSQKPKVFILEADEYQNKLQHYFPFGIILTNVELDHPDYFKTEREYQNVFEDFIKKVPPDGFFIDGRKVSYTLGKHNIFNAQLVTLAARKLGLTDDQIEKGIASFKGSPRRMEKVSDDPLIIDDYGHHPTEIKATLRAIREAYPDKEIWTVFHPHTYTRTKKFLTEFGQSFKDSDHTVVLDIYASAREITGDVSSTDVVYEIKKNGGDAYYCATFDQAAAFLKHKLNKNTLLLTIGAGDVWKLHGLLKK